MNAFTKIGHHIYAAILAFSTHTILNFAALNELPPFEQFKDDCSLSKHAAENYKVTGLHMRQGIYDWVQGMLQNP